MAFIKWGLGLASGILGDCGEEKAQAIVDQILGAL